MSFSTLHCCPLVGRSHPPYSTFSGAAGERPRMHCGTATLWLRGFALEDAPASLPTPSRPLRGLSAAVAGALASKQNRLVVDETRKRAPQAASPDTTLDAVAWKGCHDKCRSRANLTPVREDPQGERYGWS